MKIRIKLIDLNLLRENQVLNKTRTIYHNSIFRRQNALFDLQNQNVRAKPTDSWKSFN